MAPHKLSADEIRALREILTAHITPWMARELCRLALIGLKKSDKQAA